MEHDARVVANALINKAVDNAQPFTPLQTIKLVYFCHGWMLGLYERPLIAQNVQAWAYGPVIAEVYHALKHYRGDPVYSPIKGFEEETFDEFEEDLVEQVYKKYGGLDGIELSQLTHAIGTPWHQVWSQKGGRNCTIPNDLIQKHYAAKARGAQNDGEG